MNNIRILDDAKSFRQEEKASLYIDIFWEEPRNEWYKCTNCKKLFWLSKTINNDIKICLCWGNLRKIYDNDKIQKERNSQANKRGYAWKLAETLDNKLVWFMTWRADCLTNVNTEKIRLKDNQLVVLEKNIRDLYPNFDFNNVFYAAEMGIKKERRGEWIASKLFNNVLEEAQKNWYNSIILSTTTKEWWPYKRFEKLWYKVVFRYNDVNDRIIMIKQNESAQEDEWWLLWLA